jgi:alpha-glucosidase
MRTGIDGIWNDMNEPVVFGGPDNTLPPTARHAGGGNLAPGSHLQYHNLYGHLMARGSFEGMLAAHPDRRPFLLTRSGFLGSQRYAAMWTGDNHQHFGHLRLSIPMALNIGLAGQPFNGPDVGGFIATDNTEAYRQWFVLGPFYPFFRQHTTKGHKREPWQLGSEIEAAAKIAIERRYRLLPYIYTQFEAHTHDGRPVMQPTFFADPKDPALRTEDQAFLLGPDLLVVPRWALQPDPQVHPFVEALKATKAALPDGIWRSVSLVGEPLDDPLQPDLRIRGGAIIPLGRVVQNTTEESLDPLTLLIAPDANGRAEGVLYEDDGDGFSYREGNFLRTTYIAETVGDTLQLRIAREEGNRPRPDRSIKVQVLTANGTFEGSGPDGNVKVSMR